MGWYQDFAWKEVDDPTVSAVHFVGQSCEPLWRTSASDCPRLCSERPQLLISCMVCTVDF